MGTAKLHKQGSSVVVTIPASEAKTLDLTPEYFVRFDEHGIIVLIPKLDNPFKHAKPGEYYEEGIWTDIQPIGNEVW